MKIAVFDTYVSRPDGRTMHFDVLVRDNEPDKQPDIVYAHARRYLVSKGMHAEALQTEQCRFCHIESASSSVENEINRSGFAILELGNCDAHV